MKKKNKALGPKGKKRSATTELNGTPSKLKKKQVPVKLEAESEEHESSDDGESETEVEIPKGTKVGKLDKKSPKPKEAAKAGFKIEIMSDNENEKEEDMRGKKRNATTNESNEKSTKRSKNGKATKLKRKSQTVVFDEASFSTSDNDD